MVIQKKAKKSFRFLFVLAFAFAMSMFMTSAAFADEAAEVDSWEQLVETLNRDAQVIVLTDDITADENSNPLNVKYNVSIDLRGHTIDRGLSNASQAAENGYVIKVDGGNLTIEAQSGGLITGGNNLGNGGGVIVEKGGSLILNGGTISGNKCEGNGDGEGKGGGVYVKSGSFTMWGGEITDNMAALDGGGVALIGDESTSQGSKLSLHSTVVIDGNKKVTDGNAEKNNVYLDTSYDKIILDEYSQLKDSAIGVTMKTPGVFTSSNGVKASEYAAFFSSDNYNFDVQAEGDELKLEPAPDTYPVWVGATQVTKENKGDVLGDGKVKFKLASGDTPATLTMNDPTIKNVYSNGYTAVIYSTLDKLVIKGKATLTNPATDHDSHGIYAPQCDVEMNGDFKVNAGYYSIAAQNLTVSGGNVIVNSKSVGVNAYGKLDISKGSLEAKTSSDYGVAIRSKEEITIADDLGITKPKCGIVGKKKESADGSENEYWTVLDGENVANSVTIEPAFKVTFTDGQGNTLRTEAVKAGQAATAPADPTREGYLFDGWDTDFSNVTSDLTVNAKWNMTYPVWVGATQITDKNKDDILGDGGKAKYDPDTNTLTLDNPQIKDVYSGPNAPHACIYATQNNLKIEGSASLTNPDTTDEACGIYASGSDVELNGDFTIKATYYGISASRGNIIFSGGNVNVTSDAGIQGNNIKIKGGTLTSAAQGRSLFANSMSISDGLSIVRPEYGDIVSSQSGQWIVDDSGNRANVVVISAESDLMLVTFVDGQGKILKAEAVTDGQAATAPADPTREGYNFVGWDKDFSKVTEDLTVTAKWKKIVSIKDAKVVLSATAFAYNGKVRKPSIKTIGGNALKSGTDYTAKWSNKSSKNVGTYTVTITGKGNYTGVTKATYKINPKGTSLKKPAGAKKAITVKWAKQSAKMATSRITGYQIQLATNSKFTKNKKTVTVKGYKKVSKKVTKLKGGKTYYVKIRTYKTIKGKKYYSKWSKVKAIKTKK